VGTQVPAGVARAARIADGWTAVPVPTVGEFGEQAALFAAARTAAGLPPSRHVCRLIEVACASDEASAIRRAAPYLLAKYQAYLSWGIPGITLDPGASPEDQLRQLATNRFAVGSPREVAAALLALHRAGATQAVMRVGWPGMPQKDILESLERLGREVLPEVRRRTAPGPP
jgi:alkanesulfonate monooxygenase SsuD/methylene tetrahydromethanopterin reductase-like flavin-dependent oxidoreductase (luciferase family)